MKHLEELHLSNQHPEDKDFPQLTFAEDSLQNLQVGYIVVCSTKRSVGVSAYIGH